MFHRFTSIRTRYERGGDYNPGHEIRDKTDSLTLIAACIDAEIDAATNEIMAAIGDNTAPEVKRERLAHLRRFRAELIRRRDYALIVRGEVGNRYTG